MHWSGLNELGAAWSKMHECNPDEMSRQSFPTYHEIKMYTIQNATWNKMRNKSKTWHEIKWANTKGKGKARAAQNNNNKGKKKSFKLLFIQTFKSITRGATAAETTKRKGKQKFCPKHSLRGRGRNKQRSVANIGDKPGQVWNGGPTPRRRLKSVLLRSRQGRILMPSNSRIHNPRQGPCQISVLKATTRAPPSHHRINTSNGVKQGKPPP